MEKIKKVANNYAKVLKAATDADIKRTKLNEAIDGHSLPESGQFLDEVEIVEGKMAHIRLTTTEGHKMSIGRLVASPSADNDSLTAVFTQQTKNPEKDSYNCFFLSGTRINTHLSADHAKTACDLAGQKFTTEKITRLVLPYVEKDGKAVFHKEEETARAALVPKDFYLIKVVK